MVYAVFTSLLSLVQETLYVQLFAIVESSFHVIEIDPCAVLVLFVPLSYLKRMITMYPSSSVIVAAARIREIRQRDFPGQWPSPGSLWRPLPQAEARRSSRPSSLLSSDSLLAARLQQEELWKPIMPIPAHASCARLSQPSKVKHHMPVPMDSVFSAHAANGATGMPPASAEMPEHNVLSSAHLPLEHVLTKEPSYLQSKPCRKPSFRNVTGNSNYGQSGEGLQLPFSDPPAMLPRKRIGKHRAPTDDRPAVCSNSVKRSKAVYHER